MIPKRYSIALAMRFMIAPLILPVVAIKIAPGADLATPDILKGNKIAQVIENKMVGDAGFEPVNRKHAA